MPQAGAAVAGAQAAVDMEPVRDRNDPTAALVGVLPQPVPMDRRTRDRSRSLASPAAAPPVAAIDVLADDGHGQLQYRDRQGRVGNAQLANARLSEADLGMAFYPGGQLVPEESRRVQDPLAGESASATLVSTDPMATVAAFYRAAWSRWGPGVVVQHDGGENGSPLSLSAAWPDGRLQTVTLLPDEGGTRVVLTRSRPAAMAGR